MEAYTLLNRSLVVALAILVAINLSLFVFPFKVDRSESLGLALPSIKPHWLILAAHDPSEQQLASYGVTQGTVAEANFVQSGRTNANGKLTLDVNGLKDANIGTNTGTCSAIGPFLNDANFLAGLSVLSELGLEFKTLIENKVGQNYYRVYTGPYQNNEGLVRARTKLRSAGIGDYSIIRDEDERTIISLGLFRDRNVASTAVRVYVQRVEEIKLRVEESVTIDTFWILFASKNKAIVASQLEKTSWKFSVANLVSKPCN